MVVAYRYAVLGTRLALAGNRSTREAKARESQDRLRKLLEDRVTAG
jgi:hypothetical protein